MHKISPYCAVSINDLRRSGITEALHQRLGKLKSLVKDNIDVSSIYNWRELPEYIHYIRTVLSDMEIVHRAYVEIVEKKDV